MIYVAILSGVNGLQELHVEADAIVVDTAESISTVELHKSPEQERQGVSRETIVAAFVNPIAVYEESRKRPNNQKGMIV